VFSIDVHTATHPKIALFKQSITYLKKAIYIKAHHHLAYFCAQKYSFFDDFFEPNPIFGRNNGFTFSKNILVQRNHRKTNTFTHKCRLKISQGMI
jgi:hypothetical protein